MKKRNIIVLVSVISAVLVIAGIIIAVFCFGNANSSNSETDKNPSVSTTESDAEKSTSSDFSSVSKNSSSSSIDSQASENQYSEKSDTDVPQREDGVLSGLKSIRSRFPEKEAGNPVATGQPLNVVYQGTTQRNTEQGNEDGAITELQNRITALENEIRAIE